MKLLNIIQIISGMFIFFTFLIMLRKWKDKQGILIMIFYCIYFVYFIGILILETILKNFL